MGKVIVREEPVKPLSAAELKRKEQLEGIIIRGARTFIEVGHALMEIRDRELYRTECLTFKGYVKKVFDIAESRAYQLMDAASIVDQVKNSTIVEPDETIIELLPTNEAQVRPLVKLKDKPGQLRAVWQAVVDHAPEGGITAAHVNKVVRGYLGETVKSAIRTTREKVYACQLLGVDFKAAFDALAEQIEAARSAGYKTTSREQIIKHLDALRAVIAEDGEKMAEPEFTSGHQNANKLELAGFRLFRMDESSMNIKERAGGGWPKHSGPYTTKTAMKAAFAELLQDSKHLAG